MKEIIKSLSATDWILLITFIVIAWYSWETRQLRKWQKLETILSIFFEQTKDWDSGMKARTKYPLKLREIVEKKKYDPKWAYSSSWHQPVTFRGKLSKWIKDEYIKFQNNETKN